MITTKIDLKDKFFYLQFYNSIESNLENNVLINSGVQSWVVPADGLYLVTAAGPAGSSWGGEGKLLTNFIQMNVQQIKK